MSRFLTNYTDEINISNKKCLNAIEILNKNINIKKKFRDCDNIVKIFYQEIVKYISNLILIKNSSFKNTDRIEFPYLNSKYIENPKKLKFDDLKKKKIIFNNLRPVNYENKIFVARNFHLKKELFIDFIKLKNIRLIEDTKIKIPDQEYQVRILEQIIKKILFSLGFKNDNFTFNFISYVNKFLLKEYDKNFQTKNSTLIVASNLSIKNRILSAKFLQEKTNKVISFNHSNYPFYIYKEPIRDVEYSFCTDYVSYGNSKNKIKIDRKKFLLPKFHFVTCKDFENIKIDSKILDINLNEFNKFLYTPNMFNGNIRYGPFRDIDDNIYYEFQIELMNFFKNTHIKSHPKGKKKYLYKQNSVKELNFDQIYKKYDVYIFDYFSTPFSKAISTNKPIIYFDIGLRKLESSVLEILKKRVYYFKINLDGNFKDQFNNVLIKLSSEKEKKVNLFTKTFCINTKNKNIKKLFKKLL